MNTYQTHPGTPQQPSSQYPLSPLSQQTMSYSGAGMAMHMASHNMAMNPSSSLDMNINPSASMGMNLNMGPSNMPMNLANTASNMVNPAYLAMLHAQQNSNSMNGMMNKYPYPSYFNQPQQHGQQSMGLPHSQMSNMGSQMHASHNSNNAASMQNAGQSISPTQLMSASPSQFMSGPSSQQQPQSHAHSLNLTPAQLLQQQQSGAINPASLAGGAGNMSMGGLNSNLGNMGGGMSLGVNMGGLGNVQNMGNNGNMNMQGMSNMGSGGIVPNPRMNIPPNVNPMRFAQMTPHERQAFQRHQHAATLGHGLPSDRGLSATPSQSGHERGPSLTHERPPGQHERAQSLTYERQPSQQPHERAPSQSHDPTALPGERPSSSASVRSHHSHHNLDAVAPHAMMGPPGSRPGTASGTMPQLTRMNSMNFNSAMGPMHMSSGSATNLNPNMNAMNAHLNSPATMMSQMNQPPHMNAGVTMNPQMTQMGVAGGMGMPMNRPPTRTGSAMGSPKQSQSPRMSLSAGSPTHMGMASGVGVAPGMGGVTGGSGMSAMNAGVQGNMSSGIGGGMGNSMGGTMTSGMSGVVGGPMNTGLGMGMNAQAMSGVPNMAGMSGMGNMGPMNMNAVGPGGLGGGGMMGGAAGGMMGPPVIPPAMQRPEREQMMQAQVREQSAPLQREASRPPSSSGSFIGQNLEGTNVPNIPTMGSGIPTNLAIPRQPSQPPVHSHQQSPLRKLLPGQTSIAPARKPNEMAVSTGANSVVAGPSVQGAPEGHKLPPHLAALNPAVTKITYIPYKASKTDDSADGAEDEKKSDDGPSQPEGDESKEAKKAPVRFEDPVFTLTPFEISTLKEVMAQDTIYEAIYRAKQNRMLHEMRTAGPASRPAWWDRDFAPHIGVNRRPDRFDVRYPRLHKNDGSTLRRKGARREGIRIPRRLPPELADRPEQLVPIRLEFDVEHHKMRDTFLWNLNDPVITPEMFAQTLVEDYSLLSSYHSVIVKSIQEQLSDFKAHMVDMDWKVPPSAVETTQSEDPKIEELDESGLEDKVNCGTVDRVECSLDSNGDSPIIGKGILDEEEVRWWESWRKRCRKEAFSRSATLTNRRKKRKVATGAASNSEISTTKDDNASRMVDEFELDEKKMHEDLRILIKLDIIVGSVKLDDQFEWDLENENASPEQFAEVYAKELGLGGEFQTAISHSIREQVHVYQKSLFLVGHPGGGSQVQDEDLRMAFLPSLTSGTRSMDQVQSYTPTLNYMSDGEIERSEREREKELTKRRKRNTRGRRGIALPDREPNRTYRTPAIGFPELDAATLALAAAVNAPTSRRAAAAAASLTIANMVASENGTPILPLQLPQQQPTPMVTVTPGKEKKPKGLFKPPSYPSSVLRPRAQVSAPTPSTAVESTSMLPSSLLDKEPPPPVVNPPPPDSKTAAKKAREAEREAKEKELADGQHANVINGVWHCSNCGCPENIAIGRRKGPLGDKSQCGPCGKFWHRHRRLRPVQYNPDPEYHLNLSNETDQTKTNTKKRGRAPNSAAVAEGNETPSRQKSEAEAPPPVTSTVLPSEDDRPVSPVTSASSGDEAPLAQQSLKINGTSQQPATSSRPGTPDSPRPPTDTQLTSPGEPRSGSAAPQPNGSTTLPLWLTVAMHDLQAKYPDDKFEAILRKPAPKALPEWRIKCLDCPGKLYNPGPGDTLSNYEVHLRNRQHRSRVNSRVTSSFA